jgi:hypothetical protein
MGTGIQIDDADISTIVSALASSQMFLRHKGSILLEAFMGVLSSGQINNAINRTRDYAAREFFDYVQKMRLPGGESAGLRFVASVCREIGPNDAQYAALTGVVKKYSSQPEKPVDV